MLGRQASVSWLASAREILASCSTAPARVGGDLRRLGQEQPPCDTEREMSRAALQQPRAQRGLQPLHPPAQRRRRDAERQRGLLEGLFLRHQNEAAQSFEVDPGQRQRQPRIVAIHARIRARLALYKHAMATSILA